jgi:hypothetical protein
MDDNWMKKKTEPDHGFIGVLLNPSEVAMRYEITEGTLANWRRDGRGPVWINLGDGKRPRVMYRAKDLAEWESDHVSLKDPT